MKKIILTLVMILAFISINAQISFGVAEEYQISEPTDPWPGWVEAATPVLIYIDLGFGFIAIENGYHDRFIINSLEKIREDSEQIVYEMKCVDKSTKNCTIRLTHFASGNSALTISYSDIEYAYLVRGDMDAGGYPHKYFENKREQDGGKKLEGETTI